MTASGAVVLITELALSLEEEEKQYCL